MILAVIFLIGVFLSPSVGPPATASHSQGRFALQDQTSTPTPPASPTPGKTEPSTQASPQGQTSSTSSATARHKKHKKVSPNCDSNTAQPANAAGNSTSAQANPVSATNCPPPKTIVRQGGTSEPGIQLAGGTDTGQTAQPRDASSQLLEPAEQNLKKIAGRQLTSDEQDMLNQVHQFMEQTKSAVAAGDMERAGKLAEKARALSEELAKPKE